MKKIISIIMLVAMLASMAAVNTGAAGQLLLTDTFDTENQMIWLYDVSAFKCEDGWLKGDHNAVFHQSNYSTEQNGTMMWNECAVSVDIAFYDYSVTKDDYGSGLWWKDYQLQEGVEYFEGDEINSGTIYALAVQTETRRIVLNADWREILPETTTVEGQELQDEVEYKAELVVYELPADYELSVDYSNPTILNLGMRIEPNRIRGYLDGELIIDYTTPTTIGNVKPSPLLLFNDGLMVGFDNFKVSTPDYALFSADLEPEPEPQPTGSDPVPTESKEPETSVVTETEIVSSVNKDGEVVTSVVVNSEVVTIPPAADTNPSPSVGGTSTSTGDMAFVVVAVMIVALGTAVVVKKVNVK